jgi:hypothetical protein
MGEMMIFNEDGTAEIISTEGDRENIVIYCDLCNEPVAITPEANDKVFITCLRCHAVSHIALQVSKEADESAES